MLLGITIVNYGGVVKATPGRIFSLLRVGIGGVCGTRCAKDSNWSLMHVRQASYALYYLWSPVNAF